jgi:hypothetical protein
MKISKYTIYTIWFSYSLSDTVNRFISRKHFFFFKLTHLSDNRLVWKQKPNSKSLNSLSDKVKRLLGGVNPQTHYVLFQFQHLFQIIDLLEQIHVLIELLHLLWIINKYFHFQKNKHSLFLKAIQSRNEYSNVCLKMGHCLHLSSKHQTFKDMSTCYTPI